jgi:hypothetical protein
MRHVSGLFVVAIFVCEVLVALSATAVDGSLVSGKTVGSLSPPICYRDNVPHEGNS